MDLHDFNKKQVDAWLPVNLLPYDLNKAIKYANVDPRLLNIPCATMLVAIDRERQASHPRTSPLRGIRNKNEIQAVLK